MVNVLQYIAWCTFENRRMTIMHLYVGVKIKHKKNNESANKIESRVGEIISHVILVVCDVILAQTQSRSWKKSLRNTWSKLAIRLIRFDLLLAKMSSRKERHGGDEKEKSIVCEKKTQWETGGAKKKRADRRQSWWLRYNAMIFVWRMRSGLRPAYVDGSVAS